MRRTVEISERTDQRLQEIALERSTTTEQVLSAIADSVLTNSSEPSRGRAVVSNADVMGGDACIDQTRIPVWMLVGCKRAGFSDTRILANFPSLSPKDLSVAWEFYVTHADQVESERRQHEEAD